MCLFIQQGVKKNYCSYTTTILCLQRSRGGPAVTSMTVKVKVGDRISATDFFFFYFYENFIYSDMTRYDQIMPKSISNQIWISIAYQIWVYTKYYFPGIFQFLKKNLKELFIKNKKEASNPLFLYVLFSIQNNLIKLTLKS